MWEISSWWEHCISGTDRVQWWGNGVEQGNGKRMGTNTGGLRACVAPEFSKASLGGKESQEKNLHTDLTMATWDWDLEMKKEVKDTIYAFIDKSLLRLMYTSQGLCWALGIRRKRDLIFTFMELLIWSDRWTSSVNSTKTRQPWPLTFHRHCHLLALPWPHAGCSPATAKDSQLQNSIPKVSEDVRFPPPTSQMDTLLLMSKVKFPWGRGVLMIYFNFI